MMKKSIVILTGLFLIVGMVVFANADTKVSNPDKQIEFADDYIESRRKHAAVESAINALENHGLDRCPDHGIDGFKRYVSLAVLARNIQLLGATVRQKALKRIKRRSRFENYCRLLKEIKYTHEGVEQIENMKRGIRRAYNM